MNLWNAKKFVSLYLELLGDNRFCYNQRDDCLRFTNSKWLGNNCKLQNLLLSMLTFVQSVAREDIDHCRWIYDRCYDLVCDACIVVVEVLFLSLLCLPQDQFSHFTVVKH